ncbi:MAG: hypothetical protein Q7U91_05700 [Sideroxyarcus sp.]|nr:hypothetical protein [Sideroxyarcus sp.]
MKLYTGVVVFLFILFPSMCKAGEDYYFVRIACIPEARYLQFEAKSIDYVFVLRETEFDDKLKRQRLAAWIKKGYYDPTRLEFECRMPESTYKITTTQPLPSAHGQCGAAPPITLSLYRDGELVIDRVIFGYDCFGMPTLMNVEISDGLEGRFSREMNLCVAGKKGQSCEFLSEDSSEITKAIPINQQKINDYASEKSQ